MTDPPPPVDDPLAALAKTTARAVHSAEASRAAQIVARESFAANRRRIVRVGTVVALMAILAAIPLVLVPRLADPYNGVDPLADPQQAKAYVAALLDSVLEWRSRHGGELPNSLEDAVAQGRLLPGGSAYRLEYRVEDGVPVVTLVGGKEPVVVRGGGK